MELSSYLILAPEPRGELDPLSTERASGHVSPFGSATTRAGSTRAGHDYAIETENPAGAGFSFGFDP